MGWGKSRGRNTREDDIEERTKEEDNCFNNKHAEPTCWLLIAYLTWFRCCCCCIKSSSSSGGGDNNNNVCASAYINLSGNSCHRTASAFNFQRWFSQFIQCDRKITATMKIITTVQTHTQIYTRNEQFTVEWTKYYGMKKETTFKFIFFLIFFRCCFVFGLRFKRPKPNRTIQNCLPNAKPIHI